MGFWSTFILIVIIIDAILMTVVILMQNKGGGVGILGGAASQTAFGNRGGDILTRTTSIMAGVFVVGSLLLAMLIAYEAQPKGTSEKAEHSKQSLMEKYDHLYNENFDLERSDAFGEENTENATHAEKVENTGAEQMDSDGTAENIEPDGNQNENVNADAAETETTETDAAIQEMNAEANPNAVETEIDTDKETETSTEAVPEPEDTPVQIQSADQTIEITGGTNAETEANNANNTDAAPETPTADPGN